MKPANSELTRNLCRTALVVGLAASIAANMVAAQPTWIGRIVAAWPPIVLLIVVELISRVRITKGALAFTRTAAAFLIAGVAAVVSYRHMHHVALIAGEEQLVAYLIPLTVDGLVVVASISLAEMNKRTRTNKTARKVEPKPLWSVPPVAETASLSPVPTDDRDFEKLKQLVAKGTSVTKAAEECGIPRSTAYKYLDSKSAA